MLDPQRFLPLKPDVFEILLALEPEEHHGYAILKVLEARSIRLAASLLYRKLKRLMDDGLVVESSMRPAVESDDARRRYYRLTRLGKSVLRAEASRIVGLARSGHVRSLAQEARADHA